MPNVAEGRFSLFNLQWIRQHFLALAASLAALWWFFGSEMTQDLAFYTFVVLYGGYYVIRTQQKPMQNLRIAKSQLIFDIVLMAMVLITIFDAEASGLNVAAAVIFIVAIGGADLRQFLKLRKQAK